MVGTKGVITGHRAWFLDSSGNLRMWRINRETFGRKSSQMERKECNINGEIMLCI